MFFERAKIGQNERDDLFLFQAAETYLIICDWGQRPSRYIGEVIR